MKPVFLMSVAWCAAICLLTGCSELKSFYSLGNEGRLHESPFGGSAWFMADDETKSVQLTWNKQGTYELTLERDDEELTFLIDIVEHEGVRMFDAVLDDSDMGTSDLYYIGRFEQYGECLCFEGLTTAALALLDEAGIQMLARDSGDLPKPQTKKEDADKQDFDPFDPKSWPDTDFDLVMLTAPPKQLRQAIASIDTTQPVYIPAVMLCPGSAPLDEHGNYDQDAFAELHPEAHHRLESFDD